MSFGIGDPAPVLELADTAGEPQTLPLPGEAPATVVAWTCNHCPYALAWHERIQAAARQYSERGVRFLQVNSNDPERYPADSLEAMRQRVEAGEFATPYLHDATQEVARAYGAQKTPDLFVLDADLRLAYRGAPDGDYRDEALAAAWLRGALDAVLAGERPDPAETEPVGCGIKWRG
jgi:peroxiredoxin